MSDFELGDNIVSEKLLRRKLIWHSLIPRTEGIGNPHSTSLAKIDDGMVSDSGVNLLNPVSKDTNRNA